MRLPWSRQAEERAAEPEERASFTDSIVTALLADAGGTATKTAQATAALEACAALYSAGFARARVEPDVPALRPATLALIGRDLIRKGESVHLIETEGGLMLRPAGSWDIRGGWRPENWYARLDLFGPSGNVTRFVPHAAVVHCRYSTDAARPWLGIGPMQWATATGTLAGRLESSLAAEARAAPAQLLPVPQDGGDGGDDDPLKTLKSDIAKAEGRSVFVETTAAGWGAGQGGAPVRDWEQKRVGANWPDVLRDTRRDLIEAVAAACNVPAVLLNPGSEGTSQREAFRRFQMIGLEPLGTLVAAELADKLDMPGLRLDFSPLMASDLAGKARAVGILVKSGVKLRRALRFAGMADA